jgi:hypothetical protein
MRCTPISALFSTYYKGTSGVKTCAKACVYATLCLITGSADAWSQTLADLFERTSGVAINTSELRNNNDGPERTPRPSPEALRHARSKVEDVYGADFRRANTAEMQKALAVSIMATSREEHESASRYVLIQAARDLAIRIGALDIAKEADRFTAQEFDEDEQSLQIDTLRQLSNKAPPDTLEPIVLALAEHIRGLLATADGIDSADALIKHVVNAARRSRNPNLQAAAAGVVTELRERQKAIAKLRPYYDRLRVNNNDREAAAIIGKHLCLEEGEWGEGLRFLGRATESPLSIAARAELGAQNSAAGKLRAAELWKAAFDSAAVNEKAAVGRHAISLYATALGSLSGLERTRVEKTIEEIQAAIPKSALDQDWQVIFRSADPTIWNTDSSQGHNRFATALNRVPAGIKFLRIKHESGDYIIIPMATERVGATYLGIKGVWCGAPQLVAKATIFGIGMRDANITGKGGAAVFVRKNNWLSGYGFGVDGGRNPAVWATQPHPGAVLEIAVTSRPLTREEQRKLIDLGDPVPSL